MKTPTASLLRGALCVLVASFAFSVAQAEEGKEPKKVPPGMLKKYDANKDGALDDTEKAAMEADKAKAQAKRLEKFDANKDGKLDETEIAAEKAWKQEMAEKKKAEMEKKKAEKEAAAAAK